MATVATLFLVGRSCINLLLRCHVDTDTIEAAALLKLCTPLFFDACVQLSVSNDDKMMTNNLGSTTFNISHWWHSHVTERHDCCHFDSVQFLHIIHAY